MEAKKLVLFFTLGLFHDEEKKVDLILFTLNCKKNQVGKFGANEWKTDFQFGEEKLSEKTFFANFFWIFAIVNLELDSQLLKLQQ